MVVDEDDLSTLLSSATLVFVGQAFGAVSKIVERILIANILTPDAYGEVSVGLAILTAASTLALLGFQQGVPRYISRFDSDADIRGAWLAGLLVGGTASLVIAGALVAGVDTVLALLFETDVSRTMLLLFVASLPLMVGLQIAIGAIRGFENTIYRTYTRDLIYPGLRLGLLGGLLLSGFGIVAAGYAYLGSTLAAFVVAHLLLRRLISLRGEYKMHLREMFAFSSPLMLSTVLAMFLTRADTLMLSYFKSSHQVGLYNAAYPLAGAMTLILSSFGFIYLPLASRLDAEDRRSEIDAVYTLTTKWIFVITLPVFVTVVVFSEDVLVATFGREYAPASLALTILVVGFFTGATFGRNRETVSALGDTVFLMGTNALALVANIVLNLVLIPVYGYLGAAVASMLSFVSLNLVVFAVLKRRYDITPLSRRSIRTFLFVPIPLFAIALVVDQFVSLTLATIPLFGIFLGLVALLTMSVAGCLQPADRVPLELVEDHLGVTFGFAHERIPSWPEEEGR